MKTLNWTKRFARIAAALLLGFLPGILHAQAPPGGDGWSFPTNLNSWSFHDTTNWTSDNSYAPLSFTNITSSQMGDIGNGLSLLLDSTNAAWLRYNVHETNGATNLAVDVGTVTLWFAPDWASASTNQGGAGPGNWGRLIEVGAYTTNASLGWWSLFLDSGGTNIYFSAQTNSGDGAVATYLSAPTDWASNEWHMIALTYSSTNSALYLDGDFVTNGPGVAVFPGSDVLASGFWIGSDGNGVIQARGKFDDIYTYSSPLDADTIANIDDYFYSFYAINPFNIRSFIASAPSSPGYYTSGWDAITGPGVLLWITNTSSCITSSNVWLTNIVATVVSNGVNVTFSIAGGLDGAGYDVFANAALAPSDPAYQWAWMGQGYRCNTYMITNLPPSAAFLILGTPQDTDLDGLTDAWELLIGHTYPNNPDTDNDGVSDAIEVLEGRNPLVPGAVADTGGVVGFDVYTPLN